MTNALKYQSHDNIKRMTISNHDNIKRMTISNAWQYQTHDNTKRMTISNALQVVFVRINIRSARPQRELQKRLQSCQHNFCQNSKIN